MTGPGKLLSGGAPHYVREYRQLVRFLGKDGADAKDVAERAVGGGFEAVGALQAALVKEIAPDGPFALIDVGCGSGRAAAALKDMERLSYLGTDVVPELLVHARQVAKRPDWRFEEVDALVIPAGDSSADIVMFMSVFTHLKPSEVKTYLLEAARALKPGGAVICSYLDRSNQRHVRLFRPPWRQRFARLLGRDVMISFTSEAELAGWLSDAGLSVERSLKEERYGHFVLIGRKGAKR